MRISDWSSDVCSSDLPARLADEHEGDGVLLGNDAGARAPRSERLRAARLRRQRHLAHHEQGEVRFDLAEDELADRCREAAVVVELRRDFFPRSEEHTSELQSLMRISYAVFCLKK